MEDGDDNNTEEGDNSYKNDEDSEERLFYDFEDRRTYPVLVDVNLVTDSEEFSQNLIYSTDDNNNITAYAALARNAIVSHSLNGRIDADARYNDEVFTVSWKTLGSLDLPLIYFINFLRTVVTLFSKISSTGIGRCFASLVSVARPLLAAFQSDSQ